MLPSFRLSLHRHGRSLAAQGGFSLVLAMTHACDEVEDACRRSRTCVPQLVATGGAEAQPGGAPQGGQSAVGTAGEGGLGDLGGVGPGGAASSPFGSPQSEGDACAPDGVYACTGHAKRSQLVCLEGTFAPYGTCRTTERCDTRLETEGLCQPMVLECFGHHDGDVVCRGDERVVCGVDLVTAESLGTCAGGCVDGVCSECSPDAAPTCVFNSVRSCTTQGKWDTAPCPAETPHCSAGECGTPTSCLTLQDNCGLKEDEPCCTSPVVTGGVFNRNNNTALPAAISTFRLDRFEVTVGRFREFKDAWDDGWRPDGGSGKHEHLNEGLGLVDLNQPTDFEPGWKETYLTYAAPTEDNLLGSNINVTNYATWTHAAWDNEQRPINLVTRVEAYAFCIWDGGFLPSDAEWSYAASGGDEQRPFPWGAAAPKPNAELAVHGCFFPASGTCSGYENIAPVGVAQGEGRFDQLDLAGNVNEWTFTATATLSCIDCASLTMGSSNDGKYSIARGGAFDDVAAALTRSSAQPLLTLDTTRSIRVGFRCARTP